MCSRPVGPRLATHRPGGPVPATWDSLRNAPIQRGNKGHLHSWIRTFIGADLARAPVCENHHAPLDIFADIYFDKPSEIVVLGPRGGGKSLMSAIATHMECRAAPDYAARIMGGSEQQSMQIYENIENWVMRGGGGGGSDADRIRALHKRNALYVNGSNIAILTASTRSARGPHVPRLCLDEVDEMRRDIFGSAVGMAQEDTRKGHKTSIIMTSTWHRETGLMGEQVEAARSGRFPIREFCVFEVLERCPDERSGPDLEKCPECPIMSICHEDIDGYGRGVPKAKRSNGHYSIDTLVQKTVLLGMGMIESDYLCRGPRHEGIWFRTFSDENVADEAQLRAGMAEYHPNYVVHIPIDYGVETGAVAFQVRKRATMGVIVEDIHVFGEYYSDSRGAEANARAIRETFEPLMGGKDINTCDIRIDPAASSRDPIGPTGMAEYRKGGIRAIRWWPNMSHRKLESLRLIDSFIQSGANIRNLYIHPRCTILIKAFRQYSRARVHDIWLPKPADPQHPWEEMIDALAGGLLAIYPNGREDGQPRRARVHPASIM